MNINNSNNNLSKLKFTNNFMELHKRSLTKTNSNSSLDHIHKNLNIASLNDNKDKLELSKEALFRMKQRNIDESAKIQASQPEDTIERSFISKFVTNVANATLDQTETDIEDNLKAYSSYVSGIKDGTIDKNVSFNDYADSEIKKKYQSGSLDNVLKTSDSKSDTSIKAEEAKPSADIQNSDTVIAQALQQLKDRIKTIVGNSENSLNNIFKGISVSSQDTLNDVNEIKQMITSFSSSLDKINLNSKESKSQFGESLKKVFENINKTQNSLNNYSYTHSKNVPGLSNNDLNKLTEEYEVKNQSNLKRYEDDVDLIDSIFIK